MPIIQVDEDNFNEVINEEFSKKQIVILKFETQLCDACQALDFELEEVDENYSDVSILTIDCAESADLTEEFRVQRVPTIMIYTGIDELVYEKEGILLFQDIEEILKNIKN